MISEPPILTTVLAGAFVEKLGVAPELEISLLKAGLDLQPHRFADFSVCKLSGLVIG